MDKWSEATKMWLQTQRAEKTRATYTQALGDFLSRSQRQPADVTQADVIAYRNILARADISSATIRLRLSAVASFFHYAFSQGLLECDPTMGVERPKKPVKAILSPLTLEQVTRLLELPDLTTLVGRRDRALLILLVTARLHRSELIGACCGDLVERSDGMMELHYRPRVGRANRYTLTDMASRILTEYLASRRRVGDAEPLLVAHERAHLTRTQPPLSRSSVHSIVVRYTCQAFDHPLSPEALQYSSAAIEWTWTPDDGRGGDVDALQPANTST